MFGLMGVALLGLTRGACLGNSTLTSLGFTPLNPFTPATNNTYCTGALQNAQSCVDLTQIVALTNTQKTAVVSWESANFTAALSNATNAFSDFNNLCNNTFTNANVGRKINNVTITQTMVSTCASLNSMTSGIIPLTNMTGNLSGCVNMVALTINGAYCLFTSSIASTYVTVNGNSVQITASSDVPSLVVGQCLGPLFNACFLNSVAGFLDQFTGNVTANASLTNACGSVNAIYTCMVNGTACASVTNSTLFTQFFTPTTSLIGASLSRNFGASIIAARGYAVTTRRLLMAQPTNVTTSYQLSSTGFNVATTTTGLNGTNGTGPKSSAIYGLGFLLMLVALVLN